MGPGLNSCLSRGSNYGWQCRSRQQAAGQLVKAEEHARWVRVSRQKTMQSTLLMVCDMITTHGNKSPRPPPPTARQRSPPPPAPHFPPLPDSPGSLFVALLTLPPSRFPLPFPSLPSVRHYAWHGSSTVCSAWIMSHLKLPTVPCLACVDTSRDPNDPIPPALSLPMLSPLPLSQFRGQFW